VLRPEKSIETLIDAFAKVRDLGPGLRLKIVGSGSELEALQCRAAPLGSQCEFVPAVRDVTSVLSSIDIFVLPTRSEALSNSIMEAMACGCATVASRVGGNPELIEHGATGLLFEAGNVDDLAAQLRTLILDRSLRRKVAGAGAQRIHTEFSNAASARRMAGIYERYLEARDRRKS
jgi:glycosyltransferase involved in cell wall biosynthesis